MPKVGSNQTSNHATPLTRPTSVENLTKAVSINYTNVSSLSNQKIEKNNNPLNNSTHFNSDSTGNLKKIKNVTVEKSGVSEIDKPITVVLLKYFTPVYDNNNT